MKTRVLIMATLFVCLGIAQELPSNEQTRVTTMKSLLKLAKECPTCAEELAAGFRGWNQKVADLVYNTNWHLYRVIPEKYRTFEMSEDAVTHDGNLLQYVPREMKFLNFGQLCQQALKQTDSAKEYVPAYFSYPFERRFY